MENQEMNPGMAREALVWAMSHVLTTKEFNEANEMIKHMSDSDVMAIVNSSIKMVPKDKSAKDMLKDYETLLELKGVEQKDIAIYDMEVPYMSDKDTADIIKEVDKSQPSDKICITNVEDQQLIDLWKSGTKMNGIPADLFFANSIPLLDCRIVVDERPKGGIIISYRVVIFEDYPKKIEIAGMNESVIVGAVLIPITGRKGEFLIPLVVVKGVDRLAIAPIAFKDTSETFKKDFKSKIRNGEFIDSINSFIGTWYGIQIALLHPDVKEVFQKPQEIRDYDSPKNNSNGNKKPKLRYIKKHVINKDDLEKRIYETSGSPKRERKVLLFHVIGHWRTYKNGKKIFIQPYWKGKLRNVKGLVEEREREIVLNSEKKDTNES